MNSQLEKDVKNRILMINEDIRKNLLSLELEDSMSAEEYTTFKDTEALTTELTEDADGIRLALKNLETKVESALKVTDSQIALKVKKEDAVTELNLEEDQLTFTTKKFIVDTPNFKVNSSGCYVNGTIYANSLTAAGWSMKNNKIDGGASSIMSGGNIYAKTATCKYVTAKTFDLNADNLSHSVNISNSKWQVGDSKETRTSFVGNMHLKEYNCTCNGCLDSANGDIYSSRFRLIYSSGNPVKGRNIIYCDTMIAKAKEFSDARLKENVVDITEEQAATLSKLRPIGYKLKDSDIRAAGLIAQEVVDLAKGMGTDVFVDENRGYRILCYTQLIPLMIKQIQINNEKLERIKTDGTDSIQA